MADTNKGSRTILLWCQVSLPVTTINQTELLCVIGQLSLSGVRRDKMRRKNKMKNDTGYKWPFHREVNLLFPLAWQMFPNLDVTVSSSFISSCLTNVKWTQTVFSRAFKQPISICTKTMSEFRFHFLPLLSVLKEFMVKQQKLSPTPLKDILAFFSLLFWVILQFWFTQNLYNKQMDSSVSRFQTGWEHVDVC